MMKRLFPFLLVFCCTSCFIFSKYKKTDASFGGNGNSASFSLLIPKGSSRTEQSTDSLGNNFLIYHYPGNSQFFVALMKDTFTTFLSYDTSLQNARPQPGGGWSYKGMDEKQLFWREIRKGIYRVGYRYISYSDESRFDSSANHSVRMISDKL